VVALAKETKPGAIMRKPRPLKQACISKIFMRLFKRIQAAEFDGTNLCEVA
jgi:hypothetical protein